MSVESFAAGEMAIIQALVAGRKRWSDLKRETGLTSRWLSVSLDSLEKKEVVRREVEDSRALPLSVRYELQVDFRKEHDSMLKLLAILRSRIGRRPRDYGSIEGLMDAAMFDPPLYMFCALAALYYRQDGVFRFLESQALRHLHRIIENGCLLSPTLVREHFKSEYDVELMNMTFEQFVQEIESILDSLEQYSAG